ncbi:hypothetical protein ABUW04_29340 [Streptacidiphilus sp. N1-10]|uniref:HEAT repeat domain-containing protein n=1 Tax=Streptacidiphilus jeojiensis TaxID=3229225 RepID=A0ABV6XVS1_9ACTN
MYALVKDPHERLEAVTTLGAADAELTDELVGALNCFLADHDSNSLAEVLEQVPNAVRMAARQYLSNVPQPEVGALTEFGPVEVVRSAVYFSSNDEELEEYIQGAYMIGLGIRMQNERGVDGSVGWMLQLLSDEVTVPASSEPRTWSLPAEVKLLETWTSLRLTTGLGPVRSALGVAGTASDQGRMVRIHTLLHSDRDIDYEGSGTSEFVVDIFEAEIPLEEPDE